MAVVVRLSRDVSFAQHVLMLTFTPKALLSVVDLG